MFEGLSGILDQLNISVGRLRNREEPKIKKNCYHYTEWHDMGATIPCCSLQTRPGCTPCENCQDYISNSDVSKMVREMMDKRKEKANEY